MPRNPLWELPVRVTSHEHIRKLRLRKDAAVLKVTGHIPGRDRVGSQPVMLSPLSPRQAGSGPDQDKMEPRPGGH